MPNEAKASDKPFQVWVEPGGIHAGFKEEAQAIAMRDECNARAEELGLKSRYVVRNRKPVE